MSGFQALAAPFAIEQAQSAQRARWSPDCPPPQSDLRL